MYVVVEASGAPSSERGTPRCVPGNVARARIDRAPHSRGLHTNTRIAQRYYLIKLEYNPTPEP